MGSQKQLRETKDVEMLGAMFTGFTAACMNLRMVLGAEAERLASGIEPGGWYPLARYLRLAELVGSAYTDPTPILERIGAESMRIWYEHVGHTVMKRGIDFLAIQTGDGGYRSVVRGPEDQLGSLVVARLDEASGRATLHSSTVTPRDLERGILRAGLRLCGDITFVDIDNAADPDVYELEFH